MKTWLPQCVHPVIGDENFSPKYALQIPQFPPNQLSFVIVREPLIVCLLLESFILALLEYLYIFPV